MSTAVIKSLTWFYHEFGIGSIHKTGRNAYFIILARSFRMFAYGTNALILAIFFSALKYSDQRIGLFMTLTLLGDVFLGTYLTLIADRVGRRRVLLGGSVLMIFSGAVFALFENFWILLFAAIVGVISATGGDFGPFRSIEESILSQLTTPSTRADVLAWYVTTSTLGSSIGSEASGRIVHYLLSKDGWTEVDAYHTLFWLYTAMGFVNLVLVLCLSDACELQISQKAYAQLAQDENDDNTDIESRATTQTSTPNLNTITPTSPSKWTSKLNSWFVGRLALISPQTRAVMYKLWFLLSVDSLADGMVPYTLTNYYMDLKFHPKKSTLGDITSISYFLGAIASVFAGPLSRKIGLINTMVFTHVPSSAAVLVFPLPPVLWLTAVLFLLRAGLNNMDQAPRVAFIAAVVRPEESTAVMGITSMLRTLASMLGPTVTGILASNDQFWIAYVVAGVCRLAYDFGLYAMFVNMNIDQRDPQSESQREVTNNEENNDDLEMALELDSLEDSDESLESDDDQPSRKLRT